MGAKLKEYLSDPFLADLYREIRRAGPVRSISVDVTHACNIRCRGCYFFSEKMDQFAGSEEDFDRFIAREKSRGTNYVTVVGGEPSLVVDRIRKLYRHFRVNVVTNGLSRIPDSGLENLPVAVSVWGDSETDRSLRGNGRSDLFKRALENYRDDPRVFWYYTVGSGRAEEIEGVVGRCVENGNYVFFNYYSDLSGLGGEFDHRRGFADVEQEIDRMIDLYPDRILTTRYLNRVVCMGELYGERWGYSVCTNLSVDDPANRERLKSGKPFNSHFRAYNADFTSTRRCCTGIGRDCGSCYDVWERISWILLNARRHMGSRQEFTNWLTTMYLFYLMTRFVDFDSGVRRLPEIHERLGSPVGSATGLTERPELVS